MIWNCWISTLAIVSRSGDKNNRVFFYDVDRQQSRWKNPFRKRCVRFLKVTFFRLFIHLFQAIFESVYVCVSFDIGTWNIISKQLLCIFTRSVQLVELITIANHFSLYSHCFHQASALFFIVKLIVKYFYRFVDAFKSFLIVEMATLSLMCHSILSWLSIHTFSLGCDQNKCASCHLSLMSHQAISCVIVSLLSDWTKQIL